MAIAKFFWWCWTISLDKSSILYDFHKTCEDDFLFCWFILFLLQQEWLNITNIHIQFTGLFRKFDYIDTRWVCTANICDIMFALWNSLQNLRRISETVCNAAEAETTWKLHAVTVQLQLYMFALGFYRGAHLASINSL